VLVYSDDMIIA